MTSEEFFWARRAPHFAVFSTLHTTLVIRQNAIPARAGLYACYCCWTGLYGLLNTLSVRVFFPPLFAPPAWLMFMVLSQPWLRWPVSEADSSLSRRLSQGAGATSLDLHNLSLLIRWLISDTCNNIWFSPLVCFGIISVINVASF